MATKNLTPLANKEGQIGTSKKIWLEGHFDTVYANQFTTLQRNKDYKQNEIAFCGDLTAGLYLECIVEGTTDSRAPLMTSKVANETVTDGTVTFIVRELGGLHKAQDQLRPTVHRITKYQVGDILYVSNLPTWGYLECTTAGTTQTIAPDYSVLTEEGQTIADGSVTFTLYRMGSSNMFDIVDGQLCIVYEEEDE